MESFEGCIEPFIVSCESSESCGPGEASFDHPAARQQHEASFGHRMLDDFEMDFVMACGLGRRRARIALVDIGQLNRVAGHLLYLLRQRFHLRAVALVGRRHGERQQVAQCIDRNMHLRSLAALGSV